MNARYLILVALITGCSASEQPVSFRFAVSGYLEDDRILEASGLARSYQNPGQLWVHNDRGNKPRLYAIGMDGSDLGVVKLDDVENNDWEDLASFELDGVAHLMVAEIGDNDAEFDHRSLYFVREPEPQNDGKVAASWTVNYRYPDGPRDAESAALDTTADVALILTKRDRPPRLYEVPTASSEEMVTARYLGTVDSLPKPSRQDIEFAPRNKDWWWQPVGMDISDDQRAAVILTYRGIYYYQRSADQTWLEALNTAPLVVGLGGFENAEAVSFGDNARTVVVTGENKHSAVMFVDLEEAK